MATRHNVTGGVETRQTLPDVGCLYSGSVHQRDERDFKHCLCHCNEFLWDSLEASFPKGSAVFSVRFHLINAP
jgi:hypothetical protein